MFIIYLNILCTSEALSLCLHDKLQNPGFEVFGFFLEQVALSQINEKFLQVVSFSVHHCRACPGSKGAAVSCRARKGDAGTWGWGIGGEWARRQLLALALDEKGCHRRQGTHHHRKRAGQAGLALRPFALHLKCLT